MPLARHDEVEHAPQCGRMRDPPTCLRSRRRERDAIARRARRQPLLKTLRQNAAASAPRGPHYPRL
jgi:hypothetical protein